MSYEEFLKDLTAQIMAMPGRPRDNALLFGQLLTMAVGARDTQGEEAAEGVSANEQR